MLIGAALASSRTPVVETEKKAQSPRERRYLEAIGWTGLAVIVAAFAWFPGGSHFPGVIALAPTLGTALLILSVTSGTTWLSKLLSTPLMVGIGKRSYSLPLALATDRPRQKPGRLQWNAPRSSVLAPGAVAGVLLGCAAYAGIEKPLRQRGAGRSRRLLAIGGGFSVAAIGALVVASQHPAGDGARLFDPSAFWGESFNVGKATKDRNQIVRSVTFSDVYLPPLLPGADDSWRTGGIVHLNGGSSPEVVVVGSSHALMYAKLIDDICREKGLPVAFLSAGFGSPAFFNTPHNENFATLEEAHEFDDSRRKWISQWHPAVVIVIDRWDLRFDSRDFGADLTSYLETISPLTERIIFVAQAPTVYWGYRFNLRELVAFQMKKQKELPRFNPDGAEPLRKRAVALAEAATAAFPKLRVLRADLPFYLDDGSIRYASGRTFFYADDNHLTDKGAEVDRNLFERAIAEATTDIPARKTAQ